jgi:hypothetical protein
VHPPWEPHGHALNEANASTARNTARQWHCWLQCFVWGSSGSLTVGEAVTPECFLGPHSVGARSLGINFSRPDVGEMWGMLKTVYNGSLTCIQV